MIRINEIRVFISEKNVDLKKRIAKFLRIDEYEILEYSIFRESIDARKKEPIIVYTVDVVLKNEKNILSKNKKVMISPSKEYIYPISGQKDMNRRPVIVGMGPAGLYAGLILSELGYCPIIFERGEDVQNRTNSINEFWNESKLNVNSNVQFGEGGAGTFSDGKLTTRIKDKRARKVLEEFVKHGAPEEILFKNKPHIGTDLLKPTIENMRNEIIKNGGEVKFNTKVIDIKIMNGYVQGVEVESVISGEKEFVETNDIVLAIGHSARDTFEMLKDKNVSMCQKPFAVGVRIEHSQEYINKKQYGEFTSEMFDRYGAADYRVTTDAKNDRSVYSFCMCPGGYVVASSSEENTVVTNGMSEYKRDSNNANSALLVNVRPEDFGSEDVLAGVKFQRDIEKEAFKMGGSNYNAPVISVEAFIGKEEFNYKNKIKATYLPGINYTKFEGNIPNFVLESLKEGIIKIENRFSGFSKDALITGFETRSSSPVRIIRDNITLESENVLGIYPCGEGAGYAGGIMSSAVDGIKVAEKIIEKYSVKK